MVTINDISDCKEVEQNATSISVESVHTQGPTPLPEVSQPRVEIVPVVNLLPGVIIIMAGSEEGGMPHGTLLLCEYSRVGADPLVFFRTCKKSNIHVVVSAGKRNPPFIGKLNEYLMEKKFKNVVEMDVPRCLHAKLDLDKDIERDIMSTAGNAICTHLDVGCNVLILTDTCQVGRLVACYSYAWTKCVTDLEDLKTPLRTYTKATNDKKMLANIKHYDYLRKYHQAQEWYLRSRMEGMKKRNGGSIPNIEKLSLQDVVDRGPATADTIVLDPAIEEVAAKVRAKATETGLDTKEIIEKHVRKDQNHFVWTE